MYNLENIMPGWRILRKIGEGSFGSVYEIKKAGDEFTGEYRSALKVISIPQSGSEYQSFVDDGMGDAEITAMLKSKINKISNEFSVMAQFKGTTNIVSYEDHVICPHDDGKGWDILIRMELLKTLPEYCREKGMTQSDVVKLGMDICSALKLCCQQNIVHRDIKPQNIFLNHFGDFKLGDFGVAMTSDHTTRATMAGTYAYMAPEVWSGRPYDYRVDIYSLGMVLYWLLNERRAPFLPLPPNPITDEMNKEAAGRRYNGERLPPPKNGCLQLQRIVLTACAFDPNDRFDTPEDMLSALSALELQEDGQMLVEPSREEFIGLSSVSMSSETQRGGLSIGGSSVGSVSRSQAKQSVKEEERKPAKEPKPPLGKRIAGAFGSLGKTFSRLSGRDKAIVAGAAGALVLIAVAILIWSPWSGQSGPWPAPGDNSQQSESAGGPWSEWTNVLPAEVLSGGYQVETKQQYRSAAAQRSSDSVPGQGQQLCYVEFGSFGEWTPWQEEEITESDTCQVEKKEIYQYQTLHTRQVSNEFNTVTTTSYYWSEWMTSETPVEESAQVRVNVTTQYRSRQRQVSYVMCPKDGWGEFSDTPILPDRSIAVNTRFLYRYRPQGELVGTASMDNFTQRLAKAAQTPVDVSPTEWYGGSDGCVSTALSLGAMSTDEYLAFKPEQAVSVAEVIKAADVIHWIYNGGQGDFPAQAEVNQTHIDYALSNGIVLSGDFSDYSLPATRQQAAYIMRNALPASQLIGQNIVTTITDMDINSKYYKSVYQLAQAGVIAWPSPDYAYEPERVMTRAAVAAFTEKMVCPEKRAVA